MRKHVEYLKTSFLARAIMLAPLQTVEDSNIDGKELQEAQSEYFNAMFPYREGEKERETGEMKEVLNVWMEKVKAIRVEQAYTDMSTAIKRAMREKQLTDRRMAKDARFSRLLKKRL